MRGIFFRVLPIVAAAVAAMMLMHSCGMNNNGPCAQLFYNLCDCEQGWNQREQCYAQVDVMSFSAEQNANCSLHLATCNCGNWKDPDTSKQNCGDIPF